MPADFPDEDSSVDDATFDDAVDVTDTKAEKRKALEPEHKALSVQDIENRQTYAAEEVASILSIQVRTPFLHLQLLGSGIVCTTTNSQQRPSSCYGTGVGIETGCSR